MGAGVRLIVLKKVYILCYAALLQKLPVILYNYAQHLQTPSSLCHTPFWLVEQVDCFFQTPVCSGVFSLTFRSHINSDLFLSKDVG